MRCCALLLFCVMAHHWPITDGVRARDMMRLLLCAISEISIVKKSVTSMR